VFIFKDTSGKNPLCSPFISIHLLQQNNLNSGKCLLQTELERLGWQKDTTFLSISVKTAAFVDASLRQRISSLADTPTPPPFCTAQTSPCVFMVIVNRPPITNSSFKLGSSTCTNACPVSNMQKLTKFLNLSHQTAIGTMPKDSPGDLHHPEKRM
jgi:hypothetical protein